MASFQLVLCVLFLFSFCKDTFSLPLEDPVVKTIRFRATVPGVKITREKRDEGESNQGIAEVLMNAVKDGISASSVLDSPTMMVGGFSIMMQPMPKGSEFASQLMEMVPHYMNLLPLSQGGTSSDQKFLENMNKNN